MACWNHVDVQQVMHKHKLGRSLAQITFREREPAQPIENWPIEVGYSEKSICKICNAKYKFF